MQSVTDALKSSFASQTPVYASKVELYRQVWTGSAYIYDTAIDITSQIIDAGPIMWKLDKEGFNQWTLDNTTLTVRNDRQQWKMGNPKGYFPDTYLRNNSKIKIYSGVQLADATLERPQIFTGYIKQDPIMDSGNKTAAITLTGSMSIFERFNAEDISTTVTNELLGSGSGTTFNTAQNGVAGVSVVVKRGPTADGASAATVIKPTTNYTATNSDTKGVPLTIVLVEALTATQSAWITYKYWYTDRTLEWLVLQVMTLAGVTDYSIMPANFSTNIPSLWAQTSYADWATWTRTNIGIHASGFFEKCFLFSDFSSGLTGWSTSGSVVVTGGYLQVSGGAAGKCYAWKSLYKSTGTWRWRAWIDHQPNDEREGMWFFTYELGYSFPAAYGITFNAGRAYFSRQESNGYIQVTTRLVDLGVAALSSWHEWRVTRTAAGVWNIYHDEVLVGTTTATTYADASFFYVASTGNSIYRIDDIQVTDNINDVYSFDGSASATSISPIYDMGAGLFSLGSITAQYTANLGTVTISTHTSGTSDFSSDNDPAGFLQISNTGRMVSAVKRYLKIKVLIQGLGPTGSPTIDSLSTSYYSSSISVSLVNLTGLNCLQLLDSISLKCNYERGFTAVDKFIFQQRTTTLPAVMELRSPTNIFKLQNIVDGVDRVYNYITAEIGAYSSVSSAEGDTEPNSIKKYGKIIYAVPVDALLPPVNANVTFAMTSTILAYTKNPRRRCQAIGVLNTYLELGDKITLYFEEPSAFRSWKWGDTDVEWGQPDIEYHDEAYKKSRIAFWGVDFRIEGMEIYWFGIERKIILDLVENL